jgi:prepilin-type N-terminal cleavage/methylation domain-containing protein
MIVTDSNPPTVEAQPPRHRATRFFRHPARAGFSLVELLIVVAVMAILSTLTVTSVRSVLASRAFTVALDTISNSVALARQTAMSRGLPVALVLSQPENANDTAALMVLQSSWVAGAGTGGTSGLKYSPATPWRPLAPSSDVDIDMQDFKASNSAITNAIQQTKFNGNPINEYRYILFQPDGSVEFNSTGATGNQSPNVILEQKRILKNKFQITIQGSTGRAKVTNLL